MTSNKLLLHACVLCELTTLSDVPADSSPASEWVQGFTAGSGEGYTEISQPRFMLAVKER